MRGVKHAPRAVLLEKVALSPLQVFWWQQANFCNTIAASPVDSFFHYHFACQSVGHSMPSDSGIVPVMEVNAIIEALREHLQGTHSHALHCPRASPSAGIVSCTYHQWF